MNIPILPSSLYWGMEPNHFAKMTRWAEANLNTMLREESYEALVARRTAGLLEVNAGLGVIRIRGVLDKYWSAFLLAYDGSSLVAIRRAVEAAAADPQVKSILLAIDSPGGSMDGLPEVGDALFAARQVKPVVAQVDGMAASAAYYLASQATRIVAHRMNLIGSIGVRIMLYDWHRLFENAGVEAVPIDTGEFKSAGAEGTEITENQRADFQRIVDVFFAEFLKTIERGRALRGEHLKAVADGRIFTGPEALEHGLIDGIQTFEETFAELQQPARSTRRRSRASLLRLAEME